MQRADRAAATRCGSPRKAPAAPDNIVETADLVKRLNRRIVTAEVDVRNYAALK